MINYNQPWQVLDIDITNAIRSDFDFDNLRAQSEFSNRPGALWNFSGDKLVELFDPQWLTDSLGFELRNTLLFYRDAGYTHNQAHIDYVGTVNPVPAVYALNFVINPSDDSEMVWFDCNQQVGSIGTDAEFAIPQNHYEFWPMDQVRDQEIGRRCIGNQLTLVNTGEAHNIFMGKHPRWAVSIRLVRNSQINNWKDAVNFFSPWIKHREQYND